MLTLQHSWVAMGNQGMQLMIWNQPGEQVLQTDSKGAKDASVSFGLAATLMYPCSDGLD